MIEDLDALRRYEQQLLRQAAVALDLEVLAIDFEPHAHSNLRRRQYGWFLRLCDGSERFLANGFEEAVCKLADPKAVPMRKVTFQERADALLLRLGLRPALHTHQLNE